MFLLPRPAPEKDDASLLETVPDPAETAQTNGERAKPARSRLPVETLLTGRVRSLSFHDFALLAGRELAKIFGQEPGQDAAVAGGSRE